MQLTALFQALAPVLNNRVCADQMLGQNTEPVFVDVYEAQELIDTE
jgi:hypothetical protein